MQSAAGFGASVTVMIAMSRMFPAVTAASLCQSIGMWPCYIYAVKYRKYSDYKVYAIPTICFIATTIVTLWILSEIDLHWLGAALGVFLFALAMYSLFIQKKVHITPTLAVAITFGLISGVLSGLFSIGSTLMAVYFLSISKDRESYMGNFQVLLAAISFVGIVTRILRGLYTIELFPITLCGICGIICGQLIGRRVSDKLNAAALYKLVYTLVAITGIQTLIKQLAFM